MAYQIRYAWEKEQKLIEKPRTTGVALGLLLLAAALAVRLLVPESEAVFRELLHPFTDETTIAAFGELTEQIRGGIPVGDAVATFCEEVIENAG